MPLPPLLKEGRVVSAPRRRAEATDTIHTVGRESIPVRGYCETRSAGRCGVRSGVRRSLFKEETYERILVFRDSRASQQARSAR